MSDGQTLYLDTARVAVGTESGAIRIQRHGRARTLIPLRRVNRALVTDVDNGLLQACLGIIANGGTVHFQDPTGHLRAVLQAPWTTGSDAARKTARSIMHSDGLAPFHRWRDNQRRHAWSTVFRHGYCGDFNANRKRLIRYLLFYRPRANAVSELAWLEHQLWAWLQAQTERDGLRPILLALQDKGASLGSSLTPCLQLPLIWAWVRWQREDSGFITDRTQFFELQARTRLYEQYRRHINALHWEYQRGYLITAQKRCARNGE